VLRFYKQGTKSVVRQFCKGGCEDRTRAREAEEFPLLESIARERLVKTQQAGKGLACSVVISDGAVITCTSDKFGQ
jgi:hypothetical protein